MAISQQRVMRSTSCLVLGIGFQGRRIIGLINTVLDTTVAWADLFKRCSVIVLPVIRGGSPDGITVLFG